MSKCPYSMYIYIYIDLLLVVNCKHMNQSWIDVTNVCVYIYTYIYLALNMLLVVIWWWRFANTAIFVWFVEHALNADHHGVPFLLRVPVWYDLLMLYEHNSNMFYLQILLPPKLTCPLKNSAWKMIAFPFEMAPLFRGHVIFSGVYPLWPLVVCPLFIHIECCLSQKGAVFGHHFWCEGIHGLLLTW